MHRLRHVPPLALRCAGSQPLRPHGAYSAPWSETARTVEEEEEEEEEEWEEGEEEEADNSSCAVALLYIMVQARSAVPSTSQARVADFVSGSSPWCPHRLVPASFGCISIWSNPPAAC